MKFSLSALTLLTIFAASEAAEARTILYRSAAAGRCNSLTGGNQYNGGYIIATNDPQMQFECAVDSIAINPRNVGAMTAHVFVGDDDNDPIQVRTCARHINDSFASTCGPPVFSVGTGVQHITASKPAVAKSQDWMIYLEVVVPDFEVASYALLTGFDVVAN